MLYVLDTDLNVLSLLVNAGPESCPYFDDLMKETISDGALTYEFTTLGNHEAASHLSSTGYIMRANLRGELLLFKIRSIQERKQEDGRIFKTVFCENAALELIHDIVRPTYLYFATPATALTTVLQGTEWQPGIVEWLGQENYEFTSYPTVLNAIQEINSTAGGEIVFRVELENGRVTGKYIDLLQRRGQTGTFRFDYRHDLQEVERVEDSSFLVTALIGIGERPEGGQQPVTMVGVDYTGVLPDGTQVYKSHNQDYVENPQALQRYGTRGRHRIGVFKTEETDRLALIKRTWDELMTYSEPQLQYTVKVAILSRLAGSEFGHKNYELGDGGDVIDHTFSPSLMVSARIIEREISFTDPSRDSVTLGNFIRYQPTALEIIERLQDTIRENAPIWTGTGEMIHKGPVPPSAPKDLDLWLDTSQEPHILKKYDEAAGRWINASPTEPGDIGAIPPEYADDVAREEGDRAEENAKEHAKDLVDRSEAATRDFVQKNYQATITQQKTAPSNPKENDLWIDVTETPHVWKRWDGTAWVKATATSLDELAGQLKEGQIERGAVTEEALKDGAVSTYKIALNSIIASRIADRAVLADKIATGAITAAKIAAEAVTPAKIQNGAITNEKLADLAVQAEKLADSAVTAEKIANAAIGTAAIQDAAITNAKIAEIDAGKITTGRLDAGRVQIGAGTEFAEGYDPTNIQVGGRNLVRYANTPDWRKQGSNVSVNILTTTDDRTEIVTVRADFVSAEGTTNRMWGAGQKNYSMKTLEQGKTYTISFEARTEGMNKFTVYVMTEGESATFNQVGDGEPLHDGFRKYTVKYVHPFPGESRSYIALASWTQYHTGEKPFIEFRKVKMEEGTVATAWTPAIEDTAGALPTLWAYEDTTFIDGGKIYTNSITSNSIAANAITSEKLAAGAVTANSIAANAITSEKLAVGAVTADAIAAGSITTHMIATNGLDAGVIKFGTMSGSRIMSNTVDANVLKSGTVIANDIRFSGILSGASGTFSGSIVIGSTDDAMGKVYIGNGYFQSMKTTGTTTRKTVQLDTGRIRFWHEENRQSSGSYGTSYSSSIEQTPEGLEVTGNFMANGSAFYKESTRLAPYGPVIVDTSSSSQGTRFENNRDLFQYGYANFYSNVYFSGNASLQIGSGGNVEIYPSGTVTINPANYFYINGGSSRYLSVDRYTTFNQFTAFTSTTQFTNTTTFYSSARFYSTTTLGGTTYFGGTKIIDSGEFVSSISERGYCGVGGTAGGSSNIAGVGVNFRVKKNYTPSYISLSQTSGTANSVQYTDVSNEGFFLYITKPSNAGTLYYFWRGYYSA